MAGIKRIEFERKKRGGNGFMVGTEKLFGERLEGKVFYSPTGCHLWVGSLTTSGYPELRVARKQLKIHRAILAHKFGPIPDHLFACHRCNVRRCINPDHIYLGTHADNMRDAALSGSLSERFQGEKSSSAKLNKDDVYAIRAANAGGMSYADIGRKFSITTQNAWMICKRKTWRHV